jgi:hypothetical protein
MVLSTGTCSNVGLIIYSNELKFFLRAQLLTNCKKTIMYVITQCDQLRNKAFEMK